MLPGYDALLEAAIAHVTSLKKNGDRYMVIRPPRTAPLPLPSRTISSDSLAKPEATEVSPRPVETTQADLTEIELGGLDSIRDRALVCQKCPHLVSTRKNVVFGVGNPSAELMFVGEAPGLEEDRQGEPFVGPAGQLLTRIISAMGYSRETVYIANVLKCRPDTPGQEWGNRPPTPDEMQTCLPYLQAQIDLIRPRVLVALGAVAIKALTGSSDGINRLRGEFKQFRNIPLMPTFHPSYLLRKEKEGRTVELQEKRKVWEDMLQVLEKLGREISEKQRGFFLK